MAAVTENQLKAQIKSGDISNVYLLYGPDFYTIGVYADMLIKKAVDENSRDLNYHEFGESGTDMGEFADACEALPVFAEYNCCVLKNLKMSEGRFPKDSYDILIDTIKNIPETTLLIIYYTSEDICAGGKKPDKAYKRLADNAAKYGTACMFPLKTPADNASMIESAVKKAGGAIGRNEAVRLAQICSGNALLMRSESEKLAAYADGKPITSEMIGLLCCGEDNSKMYDLTNAVMRRDKAGALRLFRELSDTQNKPSVLLLYSITGTFVDSYRVCAGLSAGRSAAEITADFGYGGRAFVINNIIKNRSALNAGALIRCIRLLTECELKLKTMPTALHNMMIEETLINMLS